MESQLEAFLLLKKFNPKPTASPAQKSVSSCTQDGIEYEHLLPVQTDEDCTFCQCFDGEVLCNSSPNCDPVNKNIQEKFATCTYAGGVYEHFATFRDGCKVCTCFNGEVSCEGDSSLLCQTRWISYTGQGLLLLITAW